MILAPHPQHDSIPHTLVSILAYSGTEGHGSMGSEGGGPCSWLT